MTAPFFTYAVIGITVIVSLIGFSNSKLFERNVFSIAAIRKDNEYSRLITSQLFHVNMSHLFFNMFSFYSFGVSIENNYGTKIAAMIYLYSALGGDALTLFIKRKDIHYSAAGASGAVCGIIFASIFLNPGGSVIIFPVPIPVPSWLYAILFMAISLYGIGRGVSRIGHEAHLGGSLTGISLAILFKPSIVETNGLLLAGITIPVIILLVYFIKGKK